MAAPLAAWILHSSRSNQMFILTSPPKTELKQNLNQLQCQFLWFSRRSRCRKQNYHIPFTSEPHLNLKIQFYLLFFLFLYFCIYLYFYLYCVRSWDKAQVLLKQGPIVPGGPIWIFELFADLPEALEQRDLLRKGNQIY